MQCYVCAEKPEVNVMLNLETTTVKTLEERILKVGLTGRVLEISRTYIYSNGHCKGTQGMEFSILGSELFNYVHHCVVPECGAEPCRSSREAKRVAKPYRPLFVSGSLDP